MRITNIFATVAGFFLLTLFNAGFAEPLPEKPIVVLITSFNNAEWYEKNLSSVFRQKYTNYRVIYVDDVSSDRTPDYVEAYVKQMGQEHRFTLVRNVNRNLALKNIYEAVHSCDDHEIVVSLDGDDWFPDKNDDVLAIVNRRFSLNNVWLTHGTIKEYPNGNVSWSLPIPADIVAKNAFREYRCPSHLRTFYAWLFKKIEIDDLLHDGKFFEMTWDMAIMYPMIEMAGERHAFIEDVVYIYNVRTPLNDNKVNPSLQNYYDRWIRAMPRYERLDDSEVPVQEAG